MTDLWPPIDPQLGAYLRAVAVGLPSASTRLAMEPEEARRLQDRLARLHWNVDVPQMDVQDLNIPLTGRVLPARLYRASSTQQTAVCLYFHGGGGVVGSIRTHDGLARRLAAANGIAVLSVGYRLGPEHWDTAAIEDAVDSLSWIAHAGDPLGLDPSRLVVCGDSFGAALAVHAAAANESYVRGISLFYAMVDTTLHSWSARSFGAGYGLTSSLLGWFDGHRRSRYAAHDVLGALDLLASRATFPATQLIVAELDPLRAGNDRLRERLQAIDALADYSVWPGMVHGFLNLPPTIAMVQSAMERIGAFMRHVLREKG